MEVFIARNGQQYGPYSSDEVQQQLSAGKLFLNDLAWTRGAKDWIFLSEFLSASAAEGQTMAAPAAPVPPLTRAAEPNPPELPTQAPPKLSGLAVASLVLGICSILLPIFASIPAVICGHVAQAKIRASSGRLTGSGIALGGLIISYLWLGLLLFAAPILAGIAIPVFGEVQLRGKETKSLSQAKQIATACQIYALDHGNQFPPNLQALIPDYLENDQLFQSPLSPGETMAYQYFGGSNKDAPDKILLMSKFADRRGKRIIMHVDGSGLIGVPSPTTPLPPRKP